MSLKDCCALGRCVQTKDLKACAACNEVLYCCREHQVEHFKQGGHKMICPGRTKGEPLKFPECAEKATKYHQQQSWLVALGYYSAMLELTERSVGLFHQQTMRILEVMATCYKMSEKFDEAAQCLQRVLLIKEMENPDGANVNKSKEAFNVMGLMGELYLAGGNVELAKQLMKKMIDVAKETFGEDSFEHGRAMCAYGTCLERNGEVTEAILSLKQAVQISGYSNCKEAAQMVAASHGFYNLGVLSFDQQQLEEAKMMFKRALELKVKGGLAADHPDIVDAKGYLSRIETGTE